jgi:hypothetical protein
VVSVTAIKTANRVQLARVAAVGWIFGAVVYLAREKVAAANVKGLPWHMAGALLVFIAGNAAIVPASSIVARAVDAR